jgi:hypothetical protein
MYFRLIQISHFFYSISAPKYAEIHMAVLYEICIYT